MRVTLFGLALCCLLGCQEFHEALTTETERSPVTPPGIAPIEEMGGLDATGEGEAPAAPHVADEGSVADDDPADTQRPEDAERPERTTIIGKTTAEMVDLQQAMAENPNLVVVENQVSGSDPLTVAATAYVSATSRLSANNFKHQLEILKATNGRYPTYEEYTQLAEQHRIEFAMLPPYQMYGYDAETGGVVILEDKAEKERRYREAGIPVE